MGKRKTDPLVTGYAMLQELTGNWKEYLRQEDEKDTIEVLRKELSVSRPAGGKSFIKKLEIRFSCGLQRQKAGRPLKQRFN